MPAKQPVAKKPAAKKATTKKTVKKAPAHHDTKAEELEKKIGNLDKKYGLVAKLLKQKRMKGILDSKAMNEVNKTIKPALTTIFVVLAVLALISAVASFFGFFGVLGLGALGVSGGFIAIMAILLLVSTVLMLLLGIGLIKKKSRLPFVLLINFAFQILVLIVSSLSRGYSAGRQRLSFIVMIALLLIVFKNKSYFNK